MGGNAEQTDVVVENNPLCINSPSSTFVRRWPSLASVDFSLRLINQSNGSTRVESEEAVGKENVRTRLRELGPTKVSDHGT